jgi:hypothetical protein
MRPNIFSDTTDCPEDFFSTSLAYIANLFPSIGRRCVQRIAALAGKEPDYFGDFAECEFIGREFLENHRASRPDLMIVCERRTIYFENKLESPISVEQMERHLAFVRQKSSSALIFVSNIQHRNPQLRSLRRYLHPLRRDHYVWADFLPAFETDHRRNSLAARVLADFKSALKENGMIGRTIKGASGSLYTRRSDASHRALEQLWEVLYGRGFKLSRKHAKETTLRAYPVKYGQYPLLNPRFVGSASGLDPHWDRECLDVAVLSKGDAGLGRKLAIFPSTRGCAFLADPYGLSDGYYYHGSFLLPVEFVGSGDDTRIDFDLLERPLNRIRTFLSH